MKQDYLQMIGEAGFERVEVMEVRTYGVETDLETEIEKQTAKAVRSIKVRAFKPETSK